MADILVILALGVVLGVLSAAAEYTFYWLQSEGMILDWYRKLISKLSLVWGMPLGLCPFCNVFWLSLSLVLITGIYIGHSYIEIVGVQFISYTIAFLLLKIIFKFVDGDDN